MRLVICVTLSDTGGVICFHNRTSFAPLQKHPKLQNKHFAITYPELARSSEILHRAVAGEIANGEIQANVEASFILFDEEFGVKQQEGLLAAVFEFEKDRPDGRVRSLWCFRN